MKIKPKNFLKAKEKYEGKTYQTNLYGNLKIVEYKSSTEVDVKFEDTGYETTTHMRLITQGEVKDCFQPTVQGFGIIGDECIRDNNGTILETYRKWESMLDRVYGRGCKKDMTNPYYNASVSEDFRWFSDFKAWCEKQIGFYNKGWALDKDILVKANKVYSPETCCFVPSEINTLLIKRDKLRGEYPVGVGFYKPLNKYVSRLSAYGRPRNLGYFSSVSEAFYAYKEAKETHIKEVANKWKDQIDPRVYEALMSYEVEITD